MLAAALTVGIVLLVGPRQVRAQEPPSQPLFSWPIDRPNYDAYTTPEECVRAAQRVRDSTQRLVNLAAGVRLDTVAYIPSDTEFTRVVDVAKRCGGRFTMENVAPESFNALFWLRLLEGKDNLAKAILARQAEHLKGAPAVRRATVVSQAIDIALKDVSPARVEMAEEIAAELDRLPNLPPLMRASWHMTIAQYARAVLDTVRLRQQLDIVDPLLNTLPRDVRASRDGQALMWQVHQIHALAHVGLLRERGVDTYVQQVVTNYAQTSGRNVDGAAAALAPFGTRPPPLVGEFQFRASGAGASHPTVGKPALVVFDVRHDCAYMLCAQSYATLRRLARRFGDAIDVTLVAQTQGYFRERPPLDPAQEAEAIRHYFLEQVRLPGTLIVERTQFTTRSAPDLRRFNELTANQRAYAIRRPLDPYMPPPPMLDVYVLASDGTVVYAATGRQDRLSPKSERGIAAVIDALVASRSSSPSDVPAAQPGAQP
jgi:hypothetical protein